MEIELTPVNENALLVTPSGDVDLATAPLLRERLLQAIAQRPGTVVVSLAHVSFIDSTGLAALVAGHHKALRNATEFRIAALSRSAAKVIAITGLARALAVYETVEEAIQDEVFVAAENHPAPQDNINSDDSPKHLAVAVEPDRTRGQRSNATGS